jgi:hypothetical protein
MKVALCFIISYEHILNKEEIWKKWIEPNKDIINVYFFYKDITKIKSTWILQHVIPPNYIQETSYFHIIPAYISLIQYALLHDVHNTWFCFLTDSCCPIISPKKFRYLFFNHYNKTIISWKYAWWNIHIYKRSNLKLLPKEMRLGNDPYFVLKRENAIQIVDFVKKHHKLTQLVCNGGVANESLFAIILCSLNELQHVLCYPTHIANWNRMTSATSPYVFKYVSEENTEFITNSVNTYPYGMFIRKIAPEFPNTELEYFIYEHNQSDDEKLVMMYNPYVIKQMILLSLFGISMAFIYMIYSLLMI